MEEELKWYGWKDITVPRKLIGETFTRGSGTWQKEYTYIFIPKGYGYDNYCFLLADSLVHLYSGNSDEYWFSICHDMKIELFYSPEHREEGKKYKRYKLTGYQLFEEIFDEYETNFAWESAERLRKEQEKKDKRDKKNMGTVICGQYTGNVYGSIYNEYQYQDYLTSFFKSEGGAYSNKKFNKVQNVKREFKIMEMSKYHFLEYEDIINAYLNEYEMYKKMYDQLNTYLDRPKKIVTKTEDIAKEQAAYCKKAMEEVKQRLQKRITVLLNYYEGVES